MSMARITYPPATARLAMSSLTLWFVRLGTTQAARTKTTTAPTRFATRIVGISSSAMRRAILRGGSVGRPSSHPPDAARLRVTSRAYSRGRRALGAREAPPGDGRERRIEDGVAPVGGPVGLLLQRRQALGCELARVLGLDLRQPFGALGRRVRVLHHRVVGGVVL